MAGDTVLERTEGVREQNIRSAAGEDQVVKATRKLGAEEVASGLKVGAGDTQESSSAEPGTEVVGGGEIVRGEGCGKREEVVVVGQDNLIGREDIRGVSDKTMVEVHGG